MPDRVNVIRPEQKVINRAAQVAQQRIVGASGGGGAGASTSHQGRDVTSEGVDGDGNIFTIHDFMLGVDALGSPDAALRVKGNSYDYGD